MDEKYQQLKNIVCGLELEMLKFQKGTNVSGTRVRGGLMTCKKLSDELRKAIMIEMKSRKETKNNSKIKKVKVEDSEEEGVEDAGRQHLPSAKTNSGEPDMPLPEPPLVRQTTKSKAKRRPRKQK